MSNKALKVYANEDILLIDWLYSGSIPDGILITLNNKALPKPIQGIVLDEKSRYLLLAYTPGIAQVIKPKIEIRSKDGSLLDEYTIKTSFKPFTKKELATLSDEARIRFLRGILRKAPVTFKSISGNVLKDFCFEFSREVTSIKQDQLVHVRIPCAIKLTQTGGEREILIWRMMSGSSDAHIKLTALIANGQCYLSIPEEFIHESDQSIYVVEDVDTFVVPFKLDKVKKLSKGITLAAKLQEGIQSSELVNDFLESKIKKKH